MVNPMEDVDIALKTGAGANLCLTCDKSRVSKQHDTLRAWADVHWAETGHVGYELRARPGWLDDRLAGGLAAWELEEERAFGDYEPPEIQMRYEVTLPLYVIKQKVRGPGEYAPNASQALTERAAALDALLRSEGLGGLKGGRKVKFLVCKEPLPGLEGSPKPKQKPIAFMWPASVALKRKGEVNVDYEWYRAMTTAYMMGAFGLDSLSTHSQTTLAGVFG